MKMGSRRPEVRASGSSSEWPVTGECTGIFKLLDSLNSALPFIALCISEENEC